METYKHTMEANLSCFICRIQFSSQLQLFNHFAGKEHKVYLDHTINSQLSPPTETPITIIFYMPSTHGSLCAPHLDAAFRSLLCFRHGKYGKNEPWQFRPSHRYP